MPLKLDDVIEEHAEEAAFLWQQREAAVHAPDYDIDELAEVDERLEAHLDGLRIGGQRGWDICKELGWDLTGEYFTAMSIAIRLASPDYVDQVLERAQGDSVASRGVISAFGWVEPRQLRGLVKNLLVSDSAYRRMIGIAACAIHRAHPKAHLVKALQNTDELLLARALKATGELGDVELLTLVKQQLEHGDDACRFQAARASVLLGDHSALKLLNLFARTDNPYRRQAMDVLLRAMQPAAAKKWIKQLAADKTQLRWALIASGMQGDPVYLPALMRQFNHPEHARVAGEAFEMITGLNIFRESLEVLPEDSELAAQAAADAREGNGTAAGIEDDMEAEDDEDLGEDMGLVIPDPDKMGAWFEQNKGRFQAGQRYLCGQPIDHVNCSRVLLSGQQRQRQAAAIERVLARPGSILFETRSQGRRQQHLLITGKG